jgi:large subunit ribosomal protein L24
MTKNFIQKMATKRFAPKLKVKTGDKVVVTAGKDKGKEGTILRVFPMDNLAVVEGVQMVTKHRKPTQNSAGGIDKMEARINISNLMLVDAQGNPTRVGRRVEEGKVVRYSKKSGQTIQ